MIKKTITRFLESYTKVNPCYWKAAVLDCLRIVKYGSSLLSARLSCLAHRTKIFEYWFLLIDATTLPSTNICSSHRNSQGFETHISVDTCNSWASCECWLKNICLVTNSRISSNARTEARNVPFVCIPPIFLWRTESGISIRAGAGNETI